MTLDRRTFLRGALVLTAAAAIPASALKALEAISPLPTLCGDGIHDDTAALNALLAGEPFRTADGFVGIAQDGTLSQCRFLVSDTLHIRRNNVTISQCYFDYPKGAKIPYLIEVHPGVSDGAIVSNIFSAPDENGMRSSILA